ncbi:MAG: substrate-binding domain-containing protein, partial [Alphaproteobacteria bacterium]|nr:substrate-binding domain-containing protein [Alphaproteobacteria bacterium]
AWSFVLCGPHHAGLAEHLAETDCAGAIAQVLDEHIERELKAASIPVVNVHDRNHHSSFPIIRFNDQAIGRAALEHLAERGIERLAFVGRARARYSEARRAAFVAAAEQAGAECHVYRPRQDNAGRWIVMMNDLARWLVGLAKPVGVFACDDACGRDVLDAARRAPVVVPDEVAVIAADDDELYHGLTSPPLSSVRLPAEMAGYRAAEVLDALLAGRPAPDGPIELDPIGVQGRQSSILAMADREIAAAVRYIRERGDRPLQVRDVLEAVTISRRSLERRFQQQLGRSPQAEIQRVHLQRARMLLAETDLSMQEVARRSGFKNADRLASVFREAEGATPTRYRRRYRRSP